MPKLSFVLVDVFAEEPLAGNPLAVVPDAQDLSDGTMKKIAREFNQSETTFLLPPTRAEADWRLRCFTPPGVEVFGAGHNALGAWWWLAAAGRLRLPNPHNVFHQEIGDRILPVEIDCERGSPSRVTMTQSPPSFGMIIEDLSRLASALGLSAAELTVEGLAPQVVSTGAAHLMAPARDRAAIQRARPNVEQLLAVLNAAGGKGCYLFCLDPVDPAATAHARFFNPTEGIAEDPATGSAAGPLACYLAARGIVKPGSLVVVEQGFAQGRPSHIEAKVEGNCVEVSGRSVIVAEGWLQL